MSIPKRHITSQIIAGLPGTYLIGNLELNSDTSSKSSQVRFDKGQ